MVSGLDTCQREEPDMEPPVVDNISEFMLVIVNLWAAKVLSASKGPRRDHAVRESSDFPAFLAVTCI